MGGVAMAKAALRVGCSRLQPGLSGGPLKASPPTQVQAEPSLGGRGTGASDSCSFSLLGHHKQALFVCPCLLISAVTNVCLADPNYRAALQSHADLSRNQAGGSARAGANRCGSHAPLAGVSSPDGSQHTPVCLTLNSTNHNNERRGALSVSQALGQTLI